LLLQLTVGLASALAQLDLSSMSTHQVPFVLVLAAFLVLVCAMPSSVYGLTSQQRTDVLNAFNSARAVYNLQPFTYNITIEQFAQSWVDNCEFKHSGNLLYGENLFAASFVVTNLSVAVSDWQTEASSYSCQSNVCNPDTVCGHYTQDMWASSVEVGCGLITNCTSGSWPTIISCNFWPPGNVEGERPYPLTQCAGYPYFSDQHFDLQIILNTTAQPYNEVAFQSSISQLLSLDDSNRVYILNNTNIGNDLVEVNLYIVTVGTSSGTTAANELTSLVDNKSPQLASNGIYAISAGYVGSGGSSSLSSWIKIFLDNTK